MNKDVIYIESEDDITDIIAKIKNAKEKIVAIVPQKNSAIIRSAVNMKLIHRAGTSVEKIIVLVTTDPTVVRLAASVKLPVTKDLKTAPAIPTLDEKIESEVEKTEVVSEEEKADETKESDAAESDTEEGTPKKEKKAKKEPKTAFSKWFMAYKLWIIIGASALAVFSVILVWMFVIAPYTKITLSVKTTSNNFSQVVKFTTNLAEEDPEYGIFYLDERKIEKKSEIEFEATGSKNIGKKASGEITVSINLNAGGTTAITPSNAFTYNDLAYYPTENTTFSWNGDINNNDCDNRINNVNQSCQITKKIRVVASACGEKYNTESDTANWKFANNSFTIKNASAITGGTDHMITVVDKSDIDQANAKLAEDAMTENKTALLSDIDEETTLAIESSFQQTTTEPVSSIEVDQEVKEGEKVILSKTTTAVIYTIDVTSVKEYIRQEAKVDHNNKIYKLGAPFIENFIQTEEGWSGKLKTSYLVGPDISETSVLESVKGIAIGEIRPTLIDAGASKVDIERPFWVNNVPTDSNKITIDINVETEE